MLIEVVKSKLILGKTVYKKGDVFECREQEASLLNASGQTKKARITVATKEAPQATGSGLSVTELRQPQDPRKVLTPARTVRRNIDTPVRAVIPRAPVRKTFGGDDDPNKKLAQAAQAQSGPAMPADGLSVGSPDTSEE